MVGQPECGGGGGEPPAQPVGGLQVHHLAPLGRHVAAVGDAGQDRGRHRPGGPDRHGADLTPASRGTPRASVISRDTPQSASNPGSPRTAAVRTSGCATPACFAMVCQSRCTVTCGRTARVVGALPASSAASTRAVNASAVACSLVRCSPGASGRGTRAGRSAAARRQTRNCPRKATMPSSVCHTDIARRAWRRRSAVIAASWSRSAKQLTAGPSERHRMLATGGLPQQEPPPRARSVGSSNQRSVSASRLACRAESSPASKASRVSSEAWVPNCRAEFDRPLGFSRGPVELPGQLVAQLALGSLGGARGIRLRGRRHDRRPPPGGYAALPARLRPGSSGLQAAGELGRSPGVPGATRRWCRGRLGWWSSMAQGATRRWRWGVRQGAAVVSGSSAVVVLDVARGVLHVAPSSRTAGGFRSQGSGARARSRRGARCCRTAGATVGLRRSGDGVRTGLASDRSSPPVREVPMPDPESLPPIDHAAHRDAVRSRLRGPQVDLLLVTDPANVRYLTGFAGSNGQVLLGQRGSRRSADHRRALPGAGERDPAGLGSRQLARPLGRRRRTRGRIVAWSSVSRRTTSPGGRGSGSASSRGTRTSSSARPADSSSRPVP
jgi:hypothetical protein